MSLKNLQGRVAWVFDEDDFDIDLIVGIRNIKITDVVELAPACHAGTVPAAGPVPLRCRGGAARCAAEVGEVRCAPLAPAAAQGTGMQYSAASSALWSTMAAGLASCAVRLHTLRDTTVTVPCTPNRPFSGFLEM